MSGLRHRLRRLPGLHEGLEDGVPIDVIDFRTLQTTTRSSTYATLTWTGNNFRQALERKTADVPAPGSCRYGRDQPMEVQFDDITCIAEGKYEGDPSLEDIVGKMPCRELGTALRAHENLHVRDCKARQQPATGYWLNQVAGARPQALPPKMLTPAGLAKEEIEAYRLPNETLGLPLRVRCRDCGEVGQLQVRPPVPTWTNSNGWIATHAS